MVALAGTGDEEDESAGVQLLRDVRGVFDKREDDRISTGDLLSALTGLEESPWSEWHKGSPITQRGISKLLKRYLIKARTVRFPDEAKPEGILRKGYLREQFEDVWKRYLPHNHPSKETQRHNGSTEPKTPDQKATQESLVSDRESPQTALESQCVPVSDKTAVYGDEEASDGSQDDHRQLTEAEYAERFRQKSEGRPPR